MAKIKLTQGQFALVDDADYDWLNQWKWYANKIKGNFYAVRNSPRINGKQSKIRMSRVILGLEQDDKHEGDHQNHNTLDNRRNNLRICSHRQNTFNRKSHSDSISKFKGVSWYKRYKNWQAHISINRKQKNLGQFNTEKEAAKAYDKVAMKEFGEYACLNFNTGGT